MTGTSDEGFRNRCHQHLAVLVAVVLSDQASLASCLSHRCHHRHRHHHHPGQSLSHQNHRIHSPAMQTETTTVKGVAAVTTATVKGVAAV